MKRGLNTFCRRNVQGSELAEPPRAYPDTSLTWSASGFLCQMTEYHLPQWGVVVTGPEQVEAAGAGGSTPAILDFEIPRI